MKVTKRSAAKSQLDAAIDLWFRDADPVPVHALLCAAHEILHRLYRRKGLSGLLFDSPRIKEEYRAEMNKRLKSWASFFKHASREQEAEEAVDFNPDLNIGFIAVCLSALQRMGEVFSDHQAAMDLWLRLHHPDFFFKNGLEDPIEVKIREHSASLSKSEFLEAFLAGRGGQPVGARGP